MPKRKREEEKEQEKTYICLSEKWDQDKLIALNELVLDACDEKIISEILQEMQSEPLSRRALTYTPSKKFPEGRLYSFLGYQSCPGWIRRLCSYQFYHDIDISNAGPTILAQILTKTLGKCPSIILNYANNRSAVFQQLREEEPELQDIPDSVLKKVFLTCVHGGQYTHHLGALGLPEDHPPIMLLCEWQEVIVRAMKTLQEHDDFKDLAEAAKKLEKPNQLGTFTSWAWQRVENKIILALRDHLLKKENMTPGVLVFDGIMVERVKPHPAVLDPAVLRRSEEYIKKRTGFEIKLVEKPLTPPKKAGIASGEKERSTR